MTDVLVRTRTVVVKGGAGRVATSAGGCEEVVDCCWVWWYLLLQQEIVMPITRVINWWGERCRLMSSSLLWSSSLLMSLQPATETASEVASLAEDIAVLQDAEQVVDDLDLVDTVGEHYGSG